LSSGVKLASISDALVKVHKDVCGRGPTNARCFVSGNALVCLFFGGLTTAEHTLIESGDLAAVDAHRRALHQRIGGPARKVVEEQLGRRVTAMTLAVDPANELETAVFVLDAAPEL
jgi:uncharacterized protein YbcI